MARLILNCEGVGLLMHELGRDIVMIGTQINDIFVTDAELKDGATQSDLVPSQRACEI
jgi:hypothetical protein